MEELKFGNIKGFCYEGNEPKAKHIMSLIGVDKWVKDNAVQLACISAPYTPAYEEKSPVFIGSHLDGYGHYYGEQTGRKFDRYVQITFNGYKIPKEEEDKLKMIPSLIDIVWVPDTNTVSFRFQFFEAYHNKLN